MTLFSRKDIQLTGFGLVIGAFITVFYDIFQDILRPGMEKQQPDIVIKFVAGTISIFIGLVLLVIFTYSARKKEN